MALLTSRTFWFSKLDSIISFFYVHQIFKHKKEDTALKKRNITLSTSETVQSGPETEEDITNKKASISDLVINSTSTDPVVKLNAVQLAR